MTKGTRIYRGRFSFEAGELPLQAVEERRYGTGYGAGSGGGLRWLFAFVDI